MKTIRKAVYETNSSSTHSITIENKGSGKYQKPLVDETGRLVPRNLSSYTHCVGEATFTTCGTKDQKAAIVVDWLTARLIDYDKTEKETYEKALGILVEKCGYTGIDRGDRDDYNFYPSTEYNNGDEAYSSDLEGETPDFESFEKFIENVVLNDNKEIIDTNTPD